MISFRIQTAVWRVSSSCVSREIYNYISVVTRADVTIIICTRVFEISPLRRDIFFSSKVSITLLRWALRNTFSIQYHHAVQYDDELLTDFLVFSCTFFSLPRKWRMRLNSKQYFGFKRVASREHRNTARIPLPCHLQQISRLRQTFISYTRWSRPFTVGPEKSSFGEMFSLPIPRPDRQ